MVKVEVEIPEELIEKLKKLYPGEDVACVICRIILEKTRSPQASPESSER